MLLVPAFAVAAIVTRRRKKTRWKNLVASRLESNLIIRKRSSSFIISTILSLLAFAAFVIALARPYAGQTTINEKVESRNIMIAIDVSKSMLSEDVSSGRLTAAKALALQLLEAFPSDNIGVLAFAGSHSLICPLTIDHLAVHDTISQLDTDSTPIDGSDLVAAVKAGSETLKQTGNRANALIILSDGSENENDLSAAVEAAKSADVQIFAIGVGTPSGGIIPSDDDPLGKHRDRAGRVVHTKLQDTTLRQLAESTNGTYISINNNPKDTIAAAINKMESFEQEGREKVIPRELYHWFLIPGCIFALASAFVRAKWRLPKTSSAASIIALLAIPSQSDAEWLDSAKQKYLEQPTLQKQGLEALENQDYAGAVQRLTRARNLATGENRHRLSIALGQANFKLGNYNQAASHYSRALISENQDTQHAAYLNTAHALFQQQWAPLKIQSIPELKPALTEKTSTLAKPKQKQYLTRLKAGFSNALEKYQDIPAKDKPIIDHITSTQQIIAVIDELLNPPETEQPPQQNQNDQKDPNEKQDKPDTQQDPEESGEKEDQGDADRKDDKSDQQQPNPDGQEDPEKQDEKKEQGKEQSEKNGEKPDDQTNGEKPGQDQSQGKQSPPTDDQKSKDQSDGPGGESEPSDLNEDESDPEQRKKNARSALQQHADLQRRPTGRSRRRWQSKPPIDW